MRWLPGFGGYGQTEQNARADSEQRRWIADRLEHGKLGLDRYARALVDTALLDPAQLTAVTHVDRIRQQADQLIGRIRGAVRGSGFLSGAEADTIEAVYRHDLTLVEQSAAAADAMEALAENPATGGEQLVGIAHRLTALADAWDEREELLAR